MARTFNRALMTAATLTLAGVVATGCTINLGAESSGTNGGGMGNGMGNGMSGSHASQTKSGTEFSGADIMFAQMMIPHHQQAVLMSNLAIKTSTNAKVVNLARQIKAAQEPEIIQMKAWLKTAGASLEMGHEMGMGGMLTADEIATLSQATGPEFDKLFLQGMIAHHQGAIHMAQMVLDSANAEASALGRAIVESQTKEITYMQGLLAN